MAARPWFKAYHRDFLEAFEQLTRDQVAAYMAVLMMIYRRGGPIEDDPSRIARKISKDTSVRMWKSLRDQLIELGKLSVTHDGMLTNARAEIVLGDGEEEHRKLAENGAKGGSKHAESSVNSARKTAGKEPETKENKGLPEKGLRESQSITDYRLQTTDSDRHACHSVPGDPRAQNAERPPVKPDNVPLDRAKMPRRSDTYEKWLGLTGGASIIDDKMVRRPMLKGYMFDVVCDWVCRFAQIADPHWRGDWWVVARWMNDGISSSTIMDAIEERVARGHYKQPVALAYFDRIVREYAARNPGRGKPRDADGNVVSEAA